MVQYLHFSILKFSLIVYDHCSPIGYISPFYPPETLGLLPCLLAKARTVNMPESVRIKMLVKPPMFVGIVSFHNRLSCIIFRQPTHMIGSIPTCPGDFDGEKLVLATLAYGERPGQRW